MVLDDIPRWNSNNMTLEAFKQIDWIPFLTFIIIANFTPGPNNITSASIGVNSGVKKALIFISGVLAGVISVMTFGGYIISLLSEDYKEYISYLKYPGAIYIIYLAYSILKSRSSDIKYKKIKELTTIDGVILQLFNPKLITYSILIYTTYLLPIAYNIFYVFLSAVFLSIFTLLATISWAIFGKIISRFLKNEKQYKLINIFLSLLLIYTAIDILLS